MVGRLKTSPLLVDFAGSAEAYRAVLDSISKQRDLPIKGLGTIQGRSDHMSFGQNGVLALHFYTAYHADYHRATDVAYKIEYAGLDRILAFAEAVLCAARR